MNNKYYATGIPIRINNRGELAFVFMEILGEAAMWNEFS